jgi:hypothetical protein
LSQEEPEQDPWGEGVKITPGFLIAFYGFFTALGWILGKSWGGFDVLRWPIEQVVPAWQQLGLGAGVGVLAVGLSRVLERYAEWARRLSDGLHELIGEQTFAMITLIAVTSSVGEEVLFRGFIQQMLAYHAFEEALGTWGAVGVTSVAFGVLHVGPDWKTFLPWTILAVAMGGVFGALFVWTGTLTAPIVAHFTINFFNLQAMQARREAQQDEAE